LWGCDNFFEREGQIDKRQKHAVDVVVADPSPTMASTEHSYHPGFDNNDDGDRSISSESTFSFLHSILERRKVALHNNRDDDDELEDKPRSIRVLNRTNNNRHCRHPIDNTKRSKKRKSINSIWFVSLVIVGMMLSIRTWNPPQKSTQDVMKTKSSINPGQERFDNPIHRDDERADDTMLTQRAESDHMDNIVGEGRGARSYEIMETSLTTRFVELRQTLSPLYSQVTPTSVTHTSSIDETSTLNPLYVLRSPQSNALFWLANIDKLQIQQNDPGLIQR